MNKSPFSLNDFGLEREVYLFQPFQVVETAGFKLVEKLARERVDAFIVGERGIGKSITAQGVAAKLALEGQKMYKYAGEDNLANLYNELWIFIYYSPGLKEEIEIFLRENRHVRIYEWLVEYCKYFSCRRKERCYFKVRNKLDPKFDEVMNHLSGIIINCPMKRFIIFSLLQFDFVVNYFRNLNMCFILDIPNNFSRFDVSHFSELITHLRKIGSVIILGNDKQYQLCNRNETLLKLPMFIFPPVGVRELKEILTIKCERANYVLNASKEALSKILSYSSSNPRKMLNICSLGSSKLSLPTSAIRALGGPKQEWIKVKQIRVKVNERYSQDVSERAIGKILSKKGCTHRCNPDSEYFVNVEEALKLVRDAKN